MISLRFFMSLFFLFLSVGAYSPPSDFLVSTTLNPAPASCVSRRRTMERLISLSLTLELTPVTPPSIPPCPASSTIVMPFVDTAEVESAVKSTHPHRRTAKSRLTKMMCFLCMTNIKRPASDTVIVFGKREKHDYFFSLCAARFSRAVASISLMRFS